MKTEALGKKITTLLDKFVKQVTKEIEKLSKSTAAEAAPKKEKKAKAEKEKGTRAKPSMTCRAKGCRKKSKGPRFRFMCEEHIGQEPVAKPTKKNSKPATAADTATDAN
jgi:hypothetical protein